MFIGRVSAVKTKEKYLGHKHFGGTTWEFLTDRWYDGNFLIKARRWLLFKLPFSIYSIASTALESMRMYSVLIPFKN